MALEMERDLLKFTRPIHYELLVQTALVFSAEFSASGLQSLKFS